MKSATVLSNRIQPSPLWQRILRPVRSPIGAGLLITGLACGSGAAPRIELTRPIEDWRTSSLSEQNIDETVVRSEVQKIREGAYGNIHSFLLVRNGALVLEEYFPGPGLFGEPYQNYDRDTLHRLYSVTKSVNATLVGMAISEGRIRSVDDPVVGFFPEYAELTGDAAKAKITIRHLLTMTAGLAWDEESLGYDDPNNSHNQMDKSGDPIRFVLNRPIAKAPGERWVYNSGLSMTLGGVLRAATGKRADEYAAEKLFAPLGITRYTWDRYEDGTVQTGGGLHLRPRDMAKIGQLHLNMGRWEAKQIVPEEWVKSATRKQAADFTYGYQWWIATGTGGGPTWVGCMAIGIGGQYIFVVPSLSLVAVFTAGNEDPRYAIQPQIIMNEIILPAVH